MLIKLFRLIALTVTLFVATSCATHSSSSPSNNANHLILDYSDFYGDRDPEEILGVNRWQWKAEQCCGETSGPEAYNIKVVVYRDVTLDKVKELFPVNEQEKKDYRYVSYNDAVGWCDANIISLRESLKTGSEEMNFDTLGYMVSMYKTALKIERSLRK